MSKSRIYPDNPNRTPTISGFYAIQVWIKDAHNVFVSLDFLVQVVLIC
jgi:hypothetical protein